ncbi:MAG: hypothetical protein Q8P72_01945 [Candidatus Roizmanbacteria bacterium]|nr:hypothetical protein [Candidatus Roizmanbacteria bacterium]
MNETPHFETIAEGLQSQEYNATPFPEYLTRERNARLGVFVPLLNEVNTSLEGIYNAHGGQNEPPAALTNEPWIKFWQKVHTMDSPYTEQLQVLWFGRDGFPEDTQGLIDHPSFRIFAHQGNLLKKMDDDGKVTFKTRKVPFEDQDFRYAVHTHVDAVGILLDTYLRVDNTDIKKIDWYHLREYADTAILLAGHDGIEEGGIVQDEQMIKAGIDAVLHDLDDLNMRKLLAVGVPTLTESSYDEMVRLAPGNLYITATSKDVFAALGQSRGIYYERKSALGELSPAEEKRLSQLYQQDLFKYLSHAKQIRYVCNMLHESGDLGQKTIADRIVLAEFGDRMADMMDLDRYLQVSDTPLNRELTFFHAAKAQYVRNQIVQSLYKVFPDGLFWGAPMGKIIQQYDALLQHKVEGLAKITGDKNIVDDYTAYWNEYFVSYQEEGDRGLVDVPSRVDQAVSHFDEFAQYKARSIVHRGLDVTIYHALHSSRS